MADYLIVLRQISLNENEITSHHLLTGMECSYGFVVPSDRNSASDKKKNKSSMDPRDASVCRLSAGSSLTHRGEGYVRIFHVEWGAPVGVDVYINRIMLKPPGHVEPNLLEISMWIRLLF